MTSIKDSVMGKPDSVDNFISRCSDLLTRPMIAGLEVLGLYACVLFYIWRWQYTHPYAWIWLWAIIIASHIAHRDTLQKLGLTLKDFRGSARMTFPLALACYVPIVIYGFVRHGLALMIPTEHMLASFFSYLLWCSFQQYLTQSYFHRRLMQIIKTPHLSSFVVALMFAGAHIPNPVLMAATGIGGFILSEIFVRYRNIWPLALAQAVGGFLIGALVPAAIIHNMRVGPGYFFYKRS